VVVVNWSDWPTLIVGAVGEMVMLDEDVPMPPPTGAVEPPGTCTTNSAGPSAHPIAATANTMAARAPARRPGPEALR
jgi:hypothetical protein